jgi:hypothetical protein
MATQKIIEITIDKSGKTNIEPVKGFTDGSCMKETEKLEAALGGDITNRTKKPEAHVAIKIGNNVNSKT